MPRLCGGCQRDGRQVVVERLHGVSRSGCAAVEHLSEFRQHRPASRDCRRLATCHDGKSPLDRPLHAARDRCVDQADGGVRQLRTQLAGSEWFGRAHIEHHAARRETSRNAVIAEQHLPHRCSIGQHGDDESARSTEIGKRPGPLALREAAEALERRRVGISRDHVVSGGDQVPCHRRTHISEPHKPDALWWQELFGHG
jgi:hypothetical protein